MAVSSERAPKGKRSGLSEWCCFTVGHRENSSPRRPLNRRSTVDPSIRYIFGVVSSLPEEPTGYIIMSCIVRAQKRSEDRLRKPCKSCSSFSKAVNSGKKNRVRENPLVLLILSSKHEFEKRFATRRPISRADSTCWYGQQTYELCRRLETMFVGALGCK